MIHTQHLLPLLVPAYPGLRDQFVATVDDWLHEDGVITPCGLFTEASHLVATRFDAGDFDGAESLFTIVERCLEEGTQDVKDGAATCFLENLINRPEIGPLAVPFMGVRSLEYCRAWDEFSGVKTPGLQHWGDHCPGTASLSGVDIRLATAHEYTFAVGPSAAA